MKAWEKVSDLGIWIVNGKVELRNGKVGEWGSVCWSCAGYVQADRAEGVRMVNRGVNDQRQGVNNLWTSFAKKYIDRFEGWVFNRGAMRSSVVGEAAAVGSGPPFPVPPPRPETERAVDVVMTIPPPPKRRGSDRNTHRVTESLRRTLRTMPLNSSITVDVPTCRALYHFCRKENIRIVTKTEEKTGPDGEGGKVRIWRIE